MDKVDDRVERLLSERFMNLATSDGVTPWICAVAFIRRGNLLYFYSGKNSRHAVHMQQNPRVAGHIWHADDEVIDGLQFTADSRELRPDELPDVVERYFNELFPDAEERAWWTRPPEAFCGDGIWRFYRLEVAEAYLIDNKVFQDTKIDARLPVRIQ